MIDRRVWLGMFNQRNIKRFEFKPNRFASIACCLVILLVVFGYYFYIGRYGFEPEQKRTDATGFAHRNTQQFLYFYYYKGLFPVATLMKDKVFSEKGADDLIRDYGDSLIMEYHHCSRLGENAKIFAYLPNAWLDGVVKPSIRLFNTIIFAAGLIGCFWGFSRNGRALLGLLIVGVMLTTPFYIYEIFGNENIFGAMAALFLGLLGLNADFLFNKKLRKWCWIAPVASGVLIGFFNEIRGEISILLVSMLILYTLTKTLNLYQKIAFAFIVISLFVLTSKGIKVYFDVKFLEAHELVKESGGHPYDGPRLKGHRFWHPIFCGLGDFGGKYGYEWRDAAAYFYAFPILQKRYKTNLVMNKYGNLLNFYDKAKIYYVRFDDIDEYEEIVKEKVLRDIQNDPIWYATVLFKRGMRVLSQTVPIPYMGWVMLLLLPFLVFLRKWDLLILIVIGFPLSATPIIIYSGGNTTSNSIYPILTLAVIIYFFIYLVRNVLLGKCGVFTAGGRTNVATST